MHAENPNVSTDCLPDFPISLHSSTIAPELRYNGDSENCSESRILIICISVFATRSKVYGNIPILHDGTGKQYDHVASETVRKAVENKILGLNRVERTFGENTMRHFISMLLFMSLLPAWASAQELDFMKMMRSQRNRDYHQDANREKYLALWNGNGAVVSVMPLWQDEEFQRELNFTPEQREQIDFLFSKGGSMGHWYQTKAQTDPVLAQMLAENAPLNDLARKDPYGETMPPETARIYREQQRNLSAYYFTESQKDVENTLTPEQMQKVRESELALMAEIPILNPSMFHSLDLTGKQKEQMEEIKKSLEPVFKQIVEELVETEDALQELKFDMFEKVGIKFNEYGQLVDENGKPLDNREAMEAKSKEMESELTKNVEMQARMKRINDQASSFMRDFKYKMYDILTDEQLITLQQMINNPSPYVKKLRDRLQKERAESKKDDWQPGINSWRPGDPVPKEYLEQRPQRKKFPGVEPSPSD